MTAEPVGGGSPIDEALRYIGAFEPEFAQRVVGAAASEIDALQAAAGGAPLPALYRQFLQRLGHGLVLDGLQAANYDVQAVLARYRFGYQPPPKFWMLGRVSGDPYFDVYVFSPDGLQTRVLAFPPPPSTNSAGEFVRQHAQFLAGNLAQFLADAAFRRHRLAGFSSQQVLSSRQPGAKRLSHCDAALAPLGLKPLWFSDDWQRFYDAPEGVAMATEYPGQQTAVLMRAHEPALLTRWTQAMRPVLDR
ncbi:hypothetical protein BurJ1DRAFT_1086 [Burkholderiales bacterium JOSHI_001]|nr:hypothetical protein BurJ1DRAFT_1086 [Burkholderiales bacterium JOSHI_001]